MFLIKKSLKLLIGVAALVLVVVVFSCTMRSGELENGNLSAWRKASLDRRTAAAQMLVASDKDTDLLVACIDKMATIPESGEMDVRTAASLCQTGIEINQNQ